MSLPGLHCAFLHIPAYTLAITNHCLQRIHDPHLLPFVVAMLVLAVFPLALAILTMRSRPVTLQRNRLDVADPCARRDTYPDLALATRHAGGGYVLPGCLLRLLGVGRHGGDTLPCRRSVFQRWGGAASRAARSAAQTVSPNEIQVILSRQRSP